MFLPNGPPGTSLQMKLTGIVATKHKRNLRTGIDTPIIDAIGPRLKSMIECFFGLWGGFVKVVNQENNTQ